MRKFSALMLVLAFIINANAQTKPNIIFILADDVAYSSMTVNGGQSFSTPFLDSMARHGMNFKACEATPLCSTSRSTFLTGQYNVRNFSNFNFLNTSSKTVANLLHDAGYATGIFGKHQASYSVDTMKNWGWDYHCIFELTEYGMKGSRYKNPVLMENGVILQGTAMQNKYGDDVLTDKIFSFIETNVNKPFFVYYPMSIGHIPFCPTPDDAEFAAWDPDKGVSDTKFYPSMMRYMDKKVGAILQKLRDLGIDKNTLVLFAGDNGTPVEISYYANGQKLKGEKAWPLEGGTHVPLYAYWPTHIADGSSSNNLIDFTDFFTMFAEAAGVTDLTSYGKLDGISFYKTMLGQPNTPKQQLYVLYNAHPGVQIDRRWAQTQMYKTYDSKDPLKAKKFYNILSDPEEKLPITDTKLTAAQKLIKQSLQAMLDTMPVWPAGPIVQTPSVVNITETGALLTGTIVSTGATQLIQRGSNISRDNQDGPYLGVTTLRDQVVATGTFSMQRTDLYPQTHYTYSLFGMNNNNSNSTGYAIDSFYTLSYPPTKQPATFAGTPASTSVKLTWGKATYPGVTLAKSAGYLLIYSTDSIKIVSNPNGKVPASIVTNGTIFKLATTTLPTQPAATATITGLAPGTKYNFLLIPYTWNGSLAATYNYLTAGAKTLSVTTTSTFAAVSERDDVNNVGSLNERALKVYQNGKHLVITMNDDKEYMVTVANNAGQVLATTKMMNQVSIPVGSYKAGTYFIRLTGIKDGQTFSAPVMLY
jgi:arylsulfatase A